MAQTLTTVATFYNVPQAELARNKLTEAGIQCVITDATTITLDWLLANAIGGIKVQVRGEDVDRAAEILGTAPEGPEGTTQAVDEDELARQALEAEREPDEVEEAPTEPADEAAISQPEAIEPPPPADERDGYARRLYLTSMFGLLIPPLFFYSLYLFLNAAFSPGQLSAQGRWHFRIGSALLFGVLSIFVLLMTPVGWALMAWLAMERSDGQ
jgi:hypothetical protein